MNIKPCPMCGGKAEPDASGDLWLRTHWVACTKCGTTGPLVDDEDYQIQKTEAQLEELAIRKWNRRAPNAEDHGRGSVP